MKLHTEIVRRFKILCEQQGKPTSGRVFPNLRVTGGFKDKLLRAKLLAEGREMPKRVKGASRKQPAHKYSWVTFHVFRHSWATWMRQYAGIDVLGLVGTDNWKDLRSASRYTHVVPRTEWDRVEQLPDVTRGKVVELKKNAG